jgi:hypothetical protein
MRPTQSRVGTSRVQAKDRVIRLRAEYNIWIRLLLESYQIWWQV